MAEFTLENVGVEFALYETSARSLKKVAFRTAVGGLIGQSDKSSHTIVTALSDITLSLRDGDRVGVIGPNGSGKTTLLRVLAGIYHPTSGRFARTGNCVPLTKSMRAHGWVRDLPAENGHQQMLKDASAGSWSFAGVPHSRDTLGS
jgi:ABC-type polysaccharide/polyol phosphate transport system ATPase subunit